MKQVFTLLALVIFLSACVREKNTADNKIVIGTIDSMHSNILKEERKIWVHVPESFKNNPKQRYPVVYLLDGNGHFYSVVGMIQQLSEVNGNTVCPEMIVVGIPNTDRTRDLTPTHVDADPPFMDSAGNKTSGGGEKFEAFIEKELIPHIDSLYPTNPYKMLIGHSFGGLTVINTMMHHGNVFNSYVAIDPSMWWDKQKLLKECASDLPTKDFKHKTLFLGIANTMDAGMDTLKVQTDTMPFTRHIRSILALSHYLSTDKQNGLRFNYKYYNTDNHGSVPLITEYDALHFIFGFYKIKLTTGDYMNITKDVIAKIVSHFDTVSTEMGFKVKPPEDMINQLAYQAMSTKHNEAAEELAKLNIANYAESAGTYDTLGDVYSAEGNKTQAEGSYKKALSIMEIPETRKKLNKLLGK